MKAFALLLSLSAAVLVGCTTTNSSKTAPVSADKYDDKSRFIAMDQGVRESLTCLGIQEARTADGRLKVTANLRNIENRRIEVQANCVFKDAQGFAVDETPFRAVFLDENATESVAFESFNTAAVAYTVRVRQAR